MALSKEITLDNGIKLSYHRIVSINKVTNDSTIIEIASYVDDNQRQKEVDYYKSNEVNKSMNVFIDTTYLSKEYSEDETIKDLYEYLKTTEKFKDSVDI